MVQLQDVFKTYENGTKALRGVNLTIRDGEFVFVVGPSGSGKSTIIKLLTAEERPSSGHVEINGFSVEKLRQRDVPYLRRTIGVVFQDYRLIENKTIYDNVAFVMRAVGAPSRVIKKRVTYVLNLVGVLHKARRKPCELSGGEQQRVAIARALVNNPDIIIADEPTGNLDPARSLELMLLFEKINSMGTTVIIVTHAREIVDQFAKRVVAIDSGILISDRTGGYYSDPDISRISAEAMQKFSEGARQRKVLEEEALGVSVATHGEEREDPDSDAPRQWGAPPEDALPRRVSVPEQTTDDLLRGLEHFSSSQRKNSEEARR